MDRRSGVSSIETGLILLLVAIAAFMAVSFLGSSVGDEMDQVPGAFDGDSVTSSTTPEPGTTAPGGGGGGGGGGGDPIEDPCEDDPDMPICTDSTVTTLAPGGG